MTKKLLLTHPKNYHSRNIKEALTEYENIKYSKVAFPDTIIDPRTMMIKSFNALVAVAAVETSWRTN